MGTMGDPDAGVPATGAVVTGAIPGTAAAAAPRSGAVDTVGSGSIGSPMVTGTAREFTPSWVMRNGRPLLECEGAASRHLTVCPQCREVPDNAMIVRAFLPAERPVLLCNPPADANGRLPIHAVFSGAGVPLEFTFPGVEVTSDVAVCMGQALCQMRMPTLRAAEAAVNYEYVVLLPGS